MNEVIAKPEASRRTKNRIKEAGPLFHLGREMPVVCLGARERVKARLLHSVKTNWVGWLPVDEIEIVFYYPD